MTEAKIDLSTVRFGKGQHPPVTPTGDRDLCIMEAVAFVAGEPWSDAPSCASPVIAAFLRNWNDSLSDEDRDRLLPASVWVPRLVGSRGNEGIELRRAYLALDWLVRTYAPAFLGLVPSLRSHAEQIRNLPEVTDAASATIAAATAANARAAAGTAAWAAAGAAAATAAGDATWAAAGDAAGDAAGTAAWAASRAAAREAAAAASRAAAQDAAAAAARAAIGNAQTLQPTVDRLQASALDLLDRMLEVRA